jgi:hypothetical protein
MNEIINNKGTPNFTQLNINQKHPDNIQQLSILTKICLRTLHEYLLQYHA